MRLPISDESWLYLAPFLRYTATFWLKIAIFSYPSFVYRPQSGWPL